MNVQVPGARLHVELRGPSTGTPLLLLHAFPLSHRMWGPQFEAFSGRYRIVAPDCRGQGASESGDGQYTLELLVDDVLAVLDALGHPSVVACGLSMGGYVLLRALERAPERFKAVVLCDTRSGADSDAARIGRAEAIRAVKRDGFPAFARGFVDRLVGPTTLEHEPQIREQVLQLMLENSELGVSGALLAIALRTDTSSTLDTLAVPALVVVGEEDALTPPAESRSMADRIPHAKLAVIPRAGHLSNLENADTFNRVLGEFLEDVMEP